MHIQRGTEVPPCPTALKNCKAIVFLINTGPDPVDNHNAIKPVFNVGPSDKTF